MACTVDDGTTETTICLKTDLSVSVCPVDCYGEWTSWSDCTRSCGKTGVNTRTFEVATEAAFGGAMCSIDALSVQSMQCNTDQICPIDCTGDWSSWRCEATCGAAVDGTRSFAITRRARFGGAECAVVEGATETEQCPYECCNQACDATEPPTVPAGTLWAVVSGGDACRASGDFAAVVGGQVNQVKASINACLAYRLQLSLPLLLLQQLVLPLLLVLLVLPLLLWLQLLLGGSGSS